MSVFSLQYRELLPRGVELELDQLIVGLNTTFDRQHNGFDASHTDVTLDSITSKDTLNSLIPISGNLQMLKGGFLFDPIGNQTHVAVRRPPQILANQNNYSPEGIGLAFGFEIESDAARQITGIDRFNRTKKVIMLGNRGNYTITLKHNNSSSLYHNRFAFTGNVDFLLLSGGYIFLYYDVGSEIWRQIGNAPTSNATLLTSGTVNTARLGSGTANSTTVLYGNNTWGAISVPTAFHETGTFQSGAGVSQDFTIDPGLTAFAKTAITYFQCQGEGGTHVAEIKSESSLRITGEDDASYTWMCDMVDFS